MTNLVLTQALVQPFAQGLIALPNAGSTGLNFLEGSMPAGISFSRASEATDFNLLGQLETVPLNAPRFDTHPTTLQPRGLLLEASRTNLMLHSEDLTNAAWVKVDSTIAANSLTSPAGLVNADLVTEGGAGNAELAQNTTIAAGSTHTQSIFLKRGNTNWLRIEATDNTSANGTRAWVNLATGTIGTVLAVGTGTDPTAVIEAIGNGWYRVQLTATVAAATTTKIRVASASADASTTRVVGATYYAWGGQSEVSTNYDSSYIPTTTAAATRAVDNANILNLSSLGFNPLEGTLVAEFEFLAGNTTAERRVFQLDDGTENNRIVLFRSGGTGLLSAGVVVGGINQIGELGAVMPTTINKIALAYRINDFAFVGNGSVLVTDTSGTLPVVNRARLGATTGGSRMDGWLRRLTYYPTRLPNSQLQQLTT